MKLNLPQQQQQQQENSEVALILLHCIGTVQEKNEYVSANCTSKLAVHYDQPIIVNPNLYLADPSTVHFIKLYGSGRKTPSDT